MSRNSIPLDINDYVTQEEVAALVSRFFSQKDVKSIDFDTSTYNSEKLGYLSEQLLLTIRVRREHNNRESMHNYTFFVKSLASNSSAFNKQVFQEESHFYANFLPSLRDIHVESWSPKCYLVKKNVLVLENLTSQGFQLAKKKLTTRQLKSAIVAIARFHACSILLEHQLKVPLTAAFQGYFKAKFFENDGGRNTRWLLAGCEVAKCVACDLDLESKYVSMAYDAIMRGNYPNDSEFNVICHQDLWMNNLMFSENNECCRLLDFQMVAYASFATDIMQLLHLNLDRATRLKLEQRALKVYHSALEQTLILNGIPNDKIICMEKVLEAVERHRFYGLFAALQIGPLVFLNKQFAREYTKDPIVHQSYHFVSRKDFVRKAMKLDQNYRSRIEESVRELVDYVKFCGIN